MTEKKSKVQDKKKRKILRFSLIAVIVVALIVSGVIFIPGLLGADSNTETIIQKRTAEVSEGDISKSLSASAPIVSSERKDYKSVTPSEVVEILIDEDSYVESGDVIMVLDTSSTDSDIKTIEEDIEDKNSQIEDKRDSIEDKYTSIDDLRVDINDKKENIADLSEDISDIEDQINENDANRVELNVMAPISGTIFDINVSSGDIVSAGTVFATVTDTTSYEIEMSFSADILESSNQEVIVYYANNIIEGEIVSLAGYTYKNKFGNYLVDVVIAFNTDIFLTKELDLTAKIITGTDEYRSIEEGSPYLADSEDITAEVSGEILKLNISEKQSVEQGDLVAVLDEGLIDEKTESLNEQIESLESQIDGLNDQIQSYNTNIDSYYEDVEDLNDDIASMFEDIAELEDEIEAVREGYEDASVKADFNGIVTNVIVGVGDSVNTNTLLFTLVSMDNPKMVVAIDELDIAEVIEELEVSVVIDALYETETTPVTAIVRSISLEGDSQGGVTTYNVTVTLMDSMEGFRLGMNATATIFTGKSEDTLYIPIEAVMIQNGRSFVYLVDDSVEGAPVADFQSSVSPDSETMVVDPTSVDGTGTVGGSGKGSVDPSTMNEEELAVFEANLADKGITLEDYIGQQETTADDTSSEPAELSDYYNGTRIVEVTTGIYNALYIEILDGLSASDVVVLPPLYTSTATSSTEDGTEEDGGIIGLPGIPGTGGGAGKTSGTLPGGEN